MKRMIIFVFLINCFFSKKYLLEVKDKAGKKEADEVMDEEVEEAEDSHSDYSLPSLKMVWSNSLGLVAVRVLVDKKVTSIYRCV